MSASRCPCGVIAYQGDIICYELPPRSDDIPGGTGAAAAPRARRLGQESWLDITPALHAAIEADQRKHRRTK